MAAITDVDFYRYETPLSSTRVQSTRRSELSIIGPPEIRYVDQHGTYFNPWASPRPDEEPVQEPPGNTPPAEKEPPTKKPPVKEPPAKEPKQIRTPGSS